MLNWFPLKKVPFHVVGGTAKRYLSTNTKDVADVVIAGGGMVGTSLACALGQSKYFKGKKIVLLEATPKPKKKEWRKTTFENRVSAITPGSKSFLEDIGVWEEIKNRRLNEFSEMKVWDGYGSISLDSEEFGFGSMAYMVENSAIVESCTDVAETLESITIEYSARLKDFENDSRDYGNGGFQENPITIMLADSREIQTKLLRQIRSSVFNKKAFDSGADGFNSFVRGKCGMKTYDYDYKQSAVVATLHLDSSSSQGNSTAWQRYLTTGPVALLPMSNCVSSLVWSTEKEKARELLELSDEEFLEEVNKAYNMENQYDYVVNSAQSLTNSLLSIIKPGSNAHSNLAKPPRIIGVEKGSRAAFPLILKHSNEYVQSRIALIGDAAHRIHPMAGQGVNLGFGDACSLTKTIEKSIMEGRDFGSVENLLSFETERQRRVIPIIAAINGLNTLFSSTFSPMVIARSLGLSVTDSLPFIKERIVRYAMD